tara:strand:- start:3243 stop:3530 length:288 start_codon:yes stop_codon:yes gene_type:complete
MKTIFKYELHPSDIGSGVFPVTMPHDAKYLHVGAQGEQIFIWAEVDTESTTLEHTFEVFGTGHEMREDMAVERNHIGSLMMHDGALVFHVYHRIN